MTLPGWLLPHTVLIEPLAGSTGTGAAFGPGFTAPAMVQDKRRTVTSATGEEVVSDTAVFLPAGTDCPSGSRVTAGGRVAIAVVVTTADGGGLPTPDHIEIALT
ncbi:hypothetical protein MXD62_16725 [Frankia sp. Mgl5]|uniref:hypothetical protein n=1 Tax=Frankia sp. Mgl5 TaxID=2933793 RepID=UPI00200F704E|nr:hypothetical protein [Frankia sp. Mgl5]MCK9928801.1 hypothetical protein [Frankia sp. Mgl5]